jgi:hypothetical protein
MQLQTVLCYNYNMIFKIKQIIYSLMVSNSPPPLQPNEKFWVRISCKFFWFSYIKLKFFG